MIDAELREAAIRQCEAMAQDTTRLDEDVALEIGVSEEARELAAEAWFAVDPEPLGIDDPSDPRRELAAAALLRSGWSP